MATILEDLQTATQVFALLRESRNLLAQSVDVQDQMLTLLARQTPALEQAVADRSFVSDSEEPGAKPLQLIAVSSIKDPITQLRPDNIIHYNYTTNATANRADLHTFQGTPIWVIIDNINASNAISISFDKQKTFKTIPADTALNFSPWTWPKDLNEFYYRSAVASIAFQIIAGEV